jgi:hypothetical protein
MLVGDGGHLGEVAGGVPQVGGGVEEGVDEGSKSRQNPV